jgi:hypothetical protein
VLKIYPDAEIDEQGNISIPSQPENTLSTPSLYSPIMQRVEK